MVSKGIFTSKFLLLGIGQKIIITIIIIIIIIIIITIKALANGDIIVLPSSEQ